MHARRPGERHPSRDGPSLREMQSYPASPSSPYEGASHVGEGVADGDGLYALASSREMRGPSMDAYPPRGNKRTSVLRKYGSTKKYREVHRSTENYGDVSRIACMKAEKKITDFVHEIPKSVMQWFAGSTE